MLPGRLGLRFALEALFLVLLAIGAGLAELRPALIVLVMAVAWVLVALIEFTAERIAASPTSYLLPTPAPPEEGEPEQVFWPPPEERTVVAPPQRPAEAQAAEPEPEHKPEPDPSRRARARARAGRRAAAGAGIGPRAGIARAAGKRPPARVPAAS